MFLRRYLRLSLFRIAPGLAFGAPSRVLTGFDSENGVHRRQVHIERPAEPCGGVVIASLLSVQMTDREPVGELKEVALVFGKHRLLDRRSKMFEGVGEITNRVTHRVDVGMAVSKDPDCAIDARCDPGLGAVRKGSRQDGLKAGLADLHDLAVGL